VNGSLTQVKSQEKNSSSQIKENMPEMLFQNDDQIIAVWWQNHHDIFV